MLIMIATGATAAMSLKNYNVIWNSPSKDFSGSMPIGNGDIGLNVWVEEDGDLLFYIGKTDSWDDNCRLLKVGKVRVKLTPNPFLRGKPFEQTLSLEDATIFVKAGAANETTAIKLWVDADHPVVQVEIESALPVEAQASFELWRTEPYELPTIEVSDVHYDHDPPDKKHFPTIVEPDSVVFGLRDRIGWYHHNIKSVGPELSARLQDMEGFKQPDPILHRTFGAVVTAARGKRIDDRHLLSPRGKTHRFSVYLLTVHPATPEEWLGAIENTIQHIEKKGVEACRWEHENWWRNFWGRSWIYATSAEPQKEAEDKAFIVTRGYILQRFINACAGRGAYPIKFNGSIFTVPNPGSPGDADYRRWGPGYWWQNTRLPYMSMCTSGDFDLMQPLFKMYGGDILEMAKYRTKHYFGHAGAYLNECVYFWGAAFNESYGWTPREKRTVKINESRWHRWEWQGGLELVWMMLDYYEHTRDEAFLKKTLLPFAFEILTFYDLHYEADGEGKIVMRPAQALETWWAATNPMPEIAGLQGTTERLLRLAPALTSEGERELWQRLQKKMPALPTREVEGKKMLAAAEEFANKNNIENPELYAVFPYRRIACGRPDIDLGRAALEKREDKGNFGWRQDDIFIAYLGLAEQAREYLAGRAEKSHEGSRFPAFWGPNYDWVPDQDHGGVLLKAVQAMLIQADGEKIFLLPAWPRDWNADFKLHAPYQTILEGKVRGGRVEELKVYPESRKKDVIVWPADGPK
jgi:hypothetical protein